MSLINSQVKSLKLNVTNIQSYLVSSNEKMRKLRSDKNNLIKTEQDKTKKAQKEKKIESSSSGLSAFGARVAKGVAKPFIGLFDRIKEFLGLIIAGIIVNNLPKLIEGITKTVSDISKTISQIGSFIKKNKWMLEGIKFMMTTFGVAVGPIIDLVKAITPSEQNRITKDSERIRDEFGRLDKDLEGDDEEINRRLNQYERNQARQTATTTSPTTTQTSRNTPTGSPDRSFREPSTPTRTDSRVPKFAAGGRVEPRRTDTGTQPAARKSMTAATTTGRQTDGSVRSKRAVQTVNYFSFFNNNTRASEAIVEKDAKNKDTFKEILTSLKTIQDIRKQIGDDDGRPSDDITGPGPGPSNEILEYDVTGGVLPSTKQGRYYGQYQNDHTYRARDYQLDPGNAVTVFVPGTVTYAGLMGNYGNVVMIKHKNGKETRYAHLSKINVNVGDEIRENERKVIGLTGGAQGAPGAGNSTGPHLHFEVRDANGTPITGYNDGDAYFRFGTVTGVRRRSPSLPPAIQGVLDKTNKKLSMSQVIKLLKDSGANNDEIEFLTAVAFKENADGSTGKIRNRPDTGDLSYGLWQINMIGSNGPSRKRQFGLSSYDDLLDPRVNARAALTILRTQGKGAWRTSFNKLTSNDYRRVRLLMNQLLTSTAIGQFPTNTTAFYQQLFYIGPQIRQA